MDQFPLEDIVNELVNSEFQYEVITKKSAEKTQRKLSHYIILRNEMITRHTFEMKEIDCIIDKYKKPLEIREKALQKKSEKIIDLKKKLQARSTTMMQLPPPALPESESESEDDRTGLNMGQNCQTYTMPR